MEVILRTDQHAILVVDDDAVLRMNATDLVERAGFVAAAAANGKQALQALESRTDIITIFTDIDMPPGISGIILAGLVRARWPTIGIIVTSGLVYPKPGSLPEDTVFFPKPYRDDDVIAAFQKI